MPLAAPLPDVSPPPGPATGPSWRWPALLPREHGLWAWVASPLLAAIVLAPGLGTAAGAGAVFALVGAGNAARSAAWGPTATAGLVGTVLAGAAGGARPEVWSATLGAMLLGGGVALWGTGGAVGRRVAHHSVWEVTIIAGLASAGAGLAVGEGAEVGPAAAALATLAAWQLVGLGWVRGQLARVLPGRAPWAAAIPVGVVAVGVALATGVGAGLPWVGLLPVGYLLRVELSLPIVHPRDARRLGLTEAGWTAGIAVVAGLLARGA